MLVAESVAVVVQVDPDVAVSVVETVVVTVVDGDVASQPLKLPLKN